MQPADSGTGALTLALRGVTEHRPGPVALPAYSCFDVISAAVGADVTVRLYDLDPSTLGPDHESLRACLREGATALIVAPLYGVPVDLDDIVPLAAEFDATIVLDAAQGAGAEYQSRPLACGGSLGVLSFGRGKGITGGGGGALLANDELGLEIVERVSDHVGPPRRGGRELFLATAQWALARPALYAIPSSLPFLRLGETAYKAPRGVRVLSRAAASMVERAFELADEEASHRRTHASRLLQRLAEVPAAGLIRPPQGASPGYLRLPVILSSESRGAVESARRLGVMPGYPSPLAELPALHGRSPDVGAQYPGALLLSERLVTLPTHGKLKERDLTALDAWISQLDRSR
jgi:dTDP-4-amino-4,6-dideoxygalactose transaminase